MKICLFGLLVGVVLSLGASGQDMIDAVKKNDIEAVRLLLDKNPEGIGERDGDGRTPLHWAARGVHFEILHLLVDKGADVKASDANLVTPLISVVSRNHPEAAKLLIAHGAEVNAVSGGRNTALHYAAQRGNVDLVKLLIAHGAKLEQKNDYQRTPLVLASRERGGIETVRLLVEAGADIDATDYSGDSSLSLAAWRGFEDIVDYLLGKGASLGTSPLKLKQLMQHAAYKRLWTLYKRIKDLGQDLRSYGGEGLTLLHAAAKGGSEAIVKDLIACGFKVNEADIYGCIPLHYAAEFGRLKVVETLVLSGSGIDTRNPVSETALNLAQKNGHRDVAAVLISRGAGRTQVKWTDIQGDYMGQPTPDSVPRLFAPGIVSDIVGGHSNVVFSPDGRLAVWTRWIESDTGYALGSNLLMSRMVDGKWSVPEILVEYGDTPFFSVQGNRLYFLKKERNEQGENLVNEIRYFSVQGTELSAPQKLPFDNSANGLYWQFSFDREENIYFSGDNGLMRSRCRDGVYQPAEKLSEIFHPDYAGGSPFISPDGDYIIFSSKELPDGVGEIDLYIGFRRTDGSWSSPVNMGHEINTPFGDHLPIVSPDGKYLFFGSRRNELGGRYWVSAGIIEKLKRGELK